MKHKIFMAKTILYMILAVMTLVFACLSLFYYSSEFDSRLVPQVRRAVVQVSRMLPQLEENEQAVREMYDSFENSRSMVYQNYEDSIETHSYSAEDAETLISHTLSWMNRVTMLGVGRQGHMIVISKDDNTILAHPDERFIGEALYPLTEMKKDSVPDISMAGKDDIPCDFYAFFPKELLSKGSGSIRRSDIFDAGIYGAAFAYKDTYILCGTALIEVIAFIIGRTFFSTLIFFAIAWVFIMFIGYSFGWQKEGLKDFRRKLTAYSCLSLIIMFIMIWYYQTIMDVTDNIATLNDHAQVALETLNTYRDYGDELSLWLDDQYLEQCRLAADLVNARGKENLSRQELSEYAKELNIRYIYVFDKNGKTVVTNSPYDHFEISEKKEDQSYAFRPLLDGRDHMIQEPQIDETGGENMQYIGVSLRDENDLADGFVQIAVDPDLREKLLSPINLQTVLDNMVIGLPEHALAIGKDSMKIVATTGLGFENTDAGDLGIDGESLKKDFNGFFEINDNTYYSAISESEDLFLMPLAGSIYNNDSFFVALKLSLPGAAAFLLFIVTALFFYKKILTLKEAEDEKEAEPVEDVKEMADEHEEDIDDERGILNRLKDVIKVQEKIGFDSRWKKYSSIPVEEQTPEKRTGRIIYYVLLIFSIALILYEISDISFGTTTSLDGFSYVIWGDWQKGINLFSFSYCLFLFCVLYVFQELINQALYCIAKISDLKNETILLLLRNALKYSSALIFFYIGLAKFGIDTKALWASVGVLSLMIGFGAKDLMNDIIAGLFIIFEGTYKIGDFVEVGNWHGIVEEIGMRYTKIRFFSETKTFNNSSIREIVNSDGEVAREVIIVPIPYETDLLEVEKLLERELAEIEKNIPGLLKPLRYQGVNSFENRGVCLRITIFCTPYKRRKARRALQREIKLLFDREHITIPYDHVVIKEYKDEEHDYTFTREDAAGVKEYDELSENGENVSPKDR